MTATDQFNEAVAKIAGPRPSLERRQAAIRLAARRNPALYQAFLQAANPGRELQAAAGSAMSPADRAQVIRGWQSVLAEETARCGDPVKAKFSAMRNHVGLHAAFMAATGPRLALTTQTTATATAPKVRTVPTTAPITATTPAPRASLSPADRAWRDRILATWRDRVRQHGSEAKARELHPTLAGAFDYVSRL